MLTSACFTQCEMSPGLAPCVGMTVGPPFGYFLRRARHFLALPVVGTPRGRDALVRVAAKPGLDARVEVHCPLLKAELDQRRARHINGKVEEKVPLAEQRIEGRRGNCRA